MDEEFEGRGRIELLETGDWVAADGSVGAEGGAARSFRYRPEAQLRMEDGQLIELDLSEAELIGGEKATRRGRWPELSAGWLGAALPDYRPGPHVPLTLELRGIRSGALVAVRGALSRRRSSRSKERSYREAELD